MSLTAEYALASPISNSTLPTGLDPEHIQLHLEPRNANRSLVSGEDGGILLFLILVQSHPSHFQRRQLIRDTWGSIRSLNGHRIHVVFLLGRPKSPKPRSVKSNQGSSPPDRRVHLLPNGLLGHEEDHLLERRGHRRAIGDSIAAHEREELQQQQQQPTAGSIQAKVEEESLKYDDIVQGK